MKTVLVVDPDAQGRQDILNALPNVDLKTVEMKDGMEVLRYLKSAPVDLVVSEVELP